MHFLPFCLDPPPRQLPPLPPRSLPLPPSSYLTSRHNDQCQYNCSPKKIRGNPQNKLGKTLSKGKFILLQERPCIICFFPRQKCIQIHRCSDRDPKRSLQFFNMREFSPPPTKQKKDGLHGRDKRKARCQLMILSTSGRHFIVIQ